MVIQWVSTSPLQSVKWGSEPGQYTGNADSTTLASCTGSYLLDCCAEAVEQLLQHTSVVPLVLGMQIVKHLDLSITSQCWMHFWRLYYTGSAIHQTVLCSSNMCHDRHTSSWLAPSLSSQNPST